MCVLLNWYVHKAMRKVYKGQTIVTCVCGKGDERERELYIWKSEGTRDFLNSIPSYAL